MKRKYMKPTVRVEKLQHGSQILSGSAVTSVNSNLTGDDEFIWGGISYFDAR